MFECSKSNIQLDLSFYIIGLAMGQLVAAIRRQITDLGWEGKVVGAHFNAGRN